MSDGPETPNGSTGETGKRTKSVAVAVVVLLAVLAGNYIWAAASFSSMMDAVEETESIMVDERPRLSSAADLIIQNPTEAQVRKNRTTIANVYASLAADLTIAADPIKSMTVLPWWARIREAQGDYLDHVAAWVDRFETVGDEPERFTERSADISSTFRLACDALRDAVPIIDIFGVGPRVEQVCES